MEDCVRVVQEHYDGDVQKEWARLERHPFEFIITTGMMDRYIKPGDKILDIGGGPGRYSIYYAKKGCDVTLVDLSPENVKFAIEKSKEMNVNIKAISGDAREVNKLGQEGILSPCELNILNQPQEVIDKWVEVAEQLCEREELLSYSEHAMYIGQKISRTMGLDEY